MAHTCTLTTQETKMRGRRVGDSLRYKGQSCLPTPQKEKETGPHVYLSLDISQYVQCSYSCLLPFLLLQMEAVMVWVLALGPLVDFSHYLSFYS